MIGELELFDKKVENIINGDYHGFEEEKPIDFNKENKR